MESLEEMTSQLKYIKPNFTRFNSDQEKLMIARLWLFREQLADALEAAIKPVEYDDEVISAKIRLREGDCELTVSKEKSDWDRVEIRIWKIIGHPRNMFYDAKKSLEIGGREISTRLTASIDRGAAAVAKDVRRKLIPVAMEIVQKANEMLAKQETDQSRMDGFVDRFLKAVPGSSVCEGRSNNEHDVKVYVKGSINDVCLRCYEKDDEHIAFNCYSAPADLVIEFFQKVAEHSKKKGKS